MNVMQNGTATAMTNRLSAKAAILATAVIGNAAIGSLVVTTDSATWFESVDPVTTIDFTDLAQNEFVTDQYAHLGATFFGTAIGHHSASIFQTDGKGILGWTQTEVELEFDLPRTEFALQFASLNFMVNFHLGEDFVGSTPVMSSFISTFIGIKSSLPFDRVEMFAFSHAVTYIDNIYFGAPIPAPGVLAFVAFVGLVSRRRRRA